MKILKQWNIVWPNVILLAALHLIAVYGFFIRFSGLWQSILFYKIIVVLTSFGVTAGAHRLWSHKTYKANKLLQVILAISNSLTYQNSIYIWCRDHRLHHKYCDTNADPHCATRGFFFSHVGWLLVRKHKDVIEKGKTIDMSDLKANPIVMFQHKYYYYIIPITWFLFPTLVPWYFWGESLKYSFTVCFVYRYIVSVNVTWSINSIAHLWGTKPYDKNIAPVENEIAKVLAFGEGFHNYHHTFPWDYKTSELGSDARNVTTYFIDFMAYLGWVTDRKTAPQELVNKRMERTGDGCHETESFWLFIKGLICFAAFIILY